MAIWKECCTKLQNNITIQSNVDTVENRAENTKQISKKHSWSYTKQFSLLTLTKRQNFRLVQIEGLYRQQNKFE